jgi:hypothetical protein
MERDLGREAEGWAARGTEKRDRWRDKQERIRDGSTEPEKETDRKTQRERRGGVQREEKE